MTRDKSLRIKVMLTAYGLDGWGSRPMGATDLFSFVQKCSASQPLPYPTA